MAEENNFRMQLEVWQSEFKALRDEILKLEDLQQITIIANLTAFGALLGIAIKEKEPVIALLIPLVSSLLGLIYLDHLVNMQKLGKYINDIIRPAVSSLVGADVLQWENYLYVRNMPNIIIGRFSFTIASFFIGMNILALTIAYNIPAQNVNLPIWYVLQWVDIVITTLGSGVAVFEMVRFSSRRKLIS